MVLTTRKLCAPAFGFLAVLLVLGYTLMSCAAPVQLSGNFSGGSVRVAVPPQVGAKAAGSSSARVLQGSAGWIELAVNDGTTTSVQRQNYDGSQSSVTFNVNIKGGKNYTLTATSGSVNYPDQPVFSVSTELNMASARSNISLNLLPVRPAGGWITFNAAYTVDSPTLAVGDFQSYQVDFGGASRLCLKGLPADFVSYAQDLATGAPIAPAVNSNGILVVERSAASGAASFLLTVYNAGSYPERPSLSAVFDNLSHFVAVCQLKTGAFSPGCMTQYGSTIYVADNVDSIVYTYDLITNAFSNFDSKTSNLWGIAKAEGQNFYFSGSQAGDNVVQWATGGFTSFVVNCTISYTELACLPGLVFADDNKNLFITSNTKHCVYYADSGSHNKMYDTLDIVSKDLMSVSGICRNGKILYVAALGNKMIYKIDTQKNWPVTAEEFANTNTTDINFVACDNNAVYYTQANTVRSMSLNSTNINASILVADFSGIGIIPGGLDVVNGVVYVACGDGNLYRLY